MATGPPDGLGQRLYLAPMVPAKLGRKPGRTAGLVPIFEHFRANMTPR